MGATFLKSVEASTWAEDLENAIRGYLYANAPLDESQEIYTEHTQGTPERVVKAFGEYVKGCATDPAIYLAKTFDASTYNEMVHIPNIRLVSMCAHHLAPIVGKIHFAYIPNRKIVGLSKIPRFIQVLAKRPQIQELLTQQIVDTFQKAVQPEGCAVHVKAYHFCMSGRGVEEPAAYTVTTALRGVFKNQDQTRQEFLHSLAKDDSIFP